MTQDRNLEAISRCQQVLQGKWLAQVLYKVNDGVAGFCALQRAIPGINRQSLMLAIRKLEEYGVLVPGPRSSGQRKDYELTDQGRTLVEVIEAMRVWGDEQIEATQQTARTPTLQVQLTRVEAIDPLDIIRRKKT